MIAKGRHYWIKVNGRRRRRRRRRHCCDYKTLR